ncbi:MAG: hypothetical protein NTW16_19820 [Bacteroidetes bacterium]|nr:hypothetical protein [Bacteroidota bacterium]
MEGNTCFGYQVIFGGCQNVAEKKERNVEDSGWTGRRNEKKGLLKNVPGAIVT